MAAQTAPAGEDRTPEPTQVRISKVAAGLLGLCRLQKQDLAPVLGIAPSGVGRALDGKRKWTPDDLEAMALFFSAQLGEPVEPGIFFRDPSTLFSQNWKKMTGAPLAVVPDVPGQQVLIFPPTASDRTRRRAYLRALSS